MTENFQILATLVAVQIVLAMAPERETRRVLAAALLSRRDGLAATAGVWAIGVVWAILGLVALAVIGALPAPVPEAMRIVCGLHLVWLGLLTVRRSFRDASGCDAGVGATPADAFRGGVLSALAAPEAILRYLSILAVTGASSLPLEEQALAALAMPSATASWNACLAIAAVKPPFARALRRGGALIARLFAGARARIVVDHR